MSDVIYGYYKLEKENENNGHLCVRLDRPPKGIDGVYKATFAFCSPEDIFSKKIARKIADGRMATERKGKRIIFRSEKKDAGSLFSKALLLVQSSDDIHKPRWLVDREIVPLKKIKVKQ